jgi:GPH family glycoside/pentoside/hexuronide:cation symporter
MTPSPHLRSREKLSYGLGDFASCIYWSTFGSFFLKFYTDVFGISGAVAGSIFLFSRVWDGVNDPLMGALADRTASRWGKFRPYILFGAVPLAVAGVLAFTTPDLGTTGKIVWAAVTYNLVMMLYTVVNIPYTALLGVVTPSSVDRTSLSSIKFVCAFGAGLLVKTTLPAMTETLGGGDLQAGYQYTLIVYGLLATALFYLTFAGTRERVRPPSAQKSDLRRDLADLAGNGPWIVLLATALPLILFIAIRSTITAHYIDYYVGEQTLVLPWVGERTYGYAELFAGFGVVGDAGSIAGVLLVAWFARRMGKKAVFVVSACVSIAATAAFHVLRPEQVGIMFALHFVGSVTGGPLCVLLWAMYADTADYSEWKRGRRATGLVFSASTMSQQIGWAVGTWYAGKMLSATGYAPNAVQQAEALDGMRAMMSTTPALAGLVAVAVFCFYPLTEKRVARIEADLAARRAAAGEGPAE